jgi:hypothetical protein
MYRRCLVVALFLGALSADLSAQQNSLPLDPGTRVRVTLRDDDSVRVTGSFLHLDHQAVAIVEPASGERVREWSSVRLLEVSRGRSRSYGAWKGGAVGAFVGMALGTIAGALAAQDLQEATDGEVGTESSMAMGGLGFGVLGGTIGAGFGAVFTPERWRPYMGPRETPSAP